MQQITTGPINPLPSGAPFAPPTVLGSSNLINLLLNQTISFFIAIFTVFASLFFIIQLFLGAYNWLTAGSDEKKAGSARQTFTNAIIGLVIVVAAYGIIALVASLFSINMFNPLGQWLGP